MQMQDKITIQAPNNIVWQALNNPNILQQAIPGCQNFTENKKNNFTVSLTQKIGPINATFDGKITLSDIIEGKSYRIKGNAKAGIAGDANGNALVSLEEDNENTILHYEVDANINGKIAQLGNRVIQAVAKKCADKFFATFKSAVEQPT